ncbi:MAG: tail fiber domain-containing protein [Candidatus Aminicenantes bacterium]|nr:tail fiber domain-containing protein [Candidatus Aminicenantes bacterium]
MEGKKRFFAAIAAVFFVFGFVVTAAAADKTRTADVSIGSFGINWQPRVSYEKITLTVACPDGQVFQKAFNNGTLPYFALSDIGEKSPNGSYTYELRVTPYLKKKTARIGAETFPGSKAPAHMNILTQSGYFTVKGGSIVTRAGAEEEPEKPQDIVHLDDVIIDGSLCVGNDCYSGLAFGFDTIVLMENNLRIFFDDTSTIQNYPRNDWRIICNDSTDGGGNYFAVQDATEVSNIFVLEAGAPDNSLYVDSHGDVGINTSTPYYELHIVDGDSPCVRLDQDGSYGWEPQKWDLCGNESNFFIRDATHASKLPFRIEPDAPTNSIFIKATTGNVGIGTGSPVYSMELERTGSDTIFAIERTDGATGKIAAGTNGVQIGSISTHKVHFVVSGGTKVLTVDIDGDVGIGQTAPSYLLHLNGGAYCDGGAWVSGSSREYKENIAGLTLTEAIETLNQLEPVKFNYKRNADEDYIGFIAEDVPELVATKDRNGMSSMDVVAVLTKVLQQQQKSVQEQQETISELKRRISQLEKK